MIKRTRIKMCGVTNIEDALEGVRAGVDALGFIFVEQSARNIAPELVKDIIAELPPFVDCVGVFVDREREEVEEIVEYCGLSYAQLHGCEDPKYCERLARFSSPCQVVKAFRVEPQSKATDFIPYESSVRGYLLDTYSKGMPGGTGKTFDWSIVERLQLKRPLILAGGLDPDNVTAAILALRPFGVDVNSGIEIEPGVKDYAKLHAFVNAVRAADNP
ncbi:MAG: phosphoribosylanthranilate isomerase [Desulfobulbaceae bacterium]|uniref:N-(5'-phosphoribosyl)anthranilate isomerase n=1 Tax=Candidatus Desulfatifera sulfidica TaxID=2841691 RepID=A0A8J6TCW6_9BACT|nr:phosphoribosylanthranilate isomerase [Candidatus Desulfatifera sulfidica]